MPSLLLQIAMEAQFDIEVNGDGNICQGNSIYSYPCFNSIRKSSHTAFDRMLRYFNCDKQLYLMALVTASERDVIN